MLSPFNAIRLNCKEEQGGDAIDDALIQTVPLPHHHNLHLVLTSKSLTVLDLVKSSVLCRHIRDSTHSIDKYGVNESVKIDPTGTIALLKTSKNFLLVYTIAADSQDEVLTVYDKNGKLLQNGNVIEYKQDQFFQLNLLETPIYKAQLRLKMVLFIKNGIRDFMALSDNYLILITDVDQQLMNLSSSSMNLLKLGDDVRKVKVLGKDDLLYVIKDSCVRVYPMKSGGFKEFKVVEITVDDIQMISNDLVVGYKDNKLHYISVVDEDPRLLKTIELPYQIRQISINYNLLAILSTTQEIHIHSKFGHHLHTNDVAIPTTKFVSFANQLILLTETELKYADVWQFNESYNRPILHNTMSSYLRIYSGNNRFVNLSIPYANYVSLNSSPLQVRSNEKFTILSNFTNFLLIHTALDGIWDYFDLQPFRKFRNIVDFQILKNDWILLNCDNEEILIVDYFSDRLIYQHQFSNSTTDGRKIIVEVEDHTVLAACDGKVYQFSYDNTKFKQDYVSNINVEVEKIIKWSGGYWLLNTVGEVYHYDIVSKSLNQRDQFTTVEKLVKINPDYALILSGTDLHLLRRDQTHITVENFFSHPIHFNFRKFQITIIEDNTPVQYNYLKDLVRHEISQSTASKIDEIYYHYKDSCSFESTMEYLLYENVIMNPDDKKPTEDDQFSKIKKLIEMNEPSKIQIIAAILRKIEIKQCLTIFDKFNIDSKYLLKKSIEFKDFRTLLNLLIIFLNFGDITNEQLIDNLKIVYSNSLNNDELLKSLLETLGFLKKLDRELLKSLIVEFERM